MSNIQENKIIIRSVFKITRCWMEPAINPVTGRYPDVVKRVNLLGEMILTDKERESGEHFISTTDVIEIFDGKTFDLDNPIDKAWWNAIKYSKKIAGDRSERDETGKLLIDGDARRYGTAEFFVERPGLESQAKNQRKREIHDARNYIYNDAPENHYNKVRLLGNPMPGMPMSEVEDYLVTIAEKAPHQIIELYTGGDTHLRLFLLDSLDKHVIYKKDKLYFYGEGIPLGATDTAVIAYFKNPENKRIVELIKEEVYPELAIKKTKEKATTTQ